MTQAEPPQGSAPPPQRNGLVREVIDRALDFASTPVRAVILIVLVVSGAVGWVLYEHRNEIIESWLTPSEVALKVRDVPAALEKLTTETDADLVQIWEVDLTTNSQRFVAARRKDGERPVIPSPRRLPIIVTVSDVRALERVLEGQPVCLNVTEIGSPLARRLAERGMTRGCAIPIPPSAQKFVGVIYLAWSKAPDSSSEQVAAGAAREIAATLVTR